VNEHLSDLALDELLAQGTSNAHVDGCADCRAKLETRKAQAQASKAAFAYARTKARVSAQVVPSPWRWIAVLVTPFALVGLLWVAIQKNPSDGERLKGAASIDFVTRDDITVTEVPAGTRLKLKIGTAGFAHARVVAVDDGGHSEQLWPETNGDDKLPGTGVVTLPREFEATPGPVTVQVTLWNEHIESGTTVARRLNISP